MDSPTDIDSTIDETQDSITIYTGISCLSSGKETAIVSIVLYIIEQPDSTVSETFTIGLYTHQKAELYAVKKAIELFDNNNKNVIISSRSSYVYSVINKYRDIVSKNDASSISSISVPNRDIIKDVLSSLTHRSKISNKLVINVVDKDDTNSIIARRMAVQNIKTFVQNRNA